ncbi:hypothetical protein SDRG_07215 [Saprolegnia diclina VS20]|uniref:Uncharacterized protein n=1 Tax=Saprolegnia diclina (strain VS20) TaxID=1156394 RepID=T0RYZ5_SAPDV|nr:hypothetical protein SDRG_07215 [Saprolegnia diclina VS20]EQC35507.1 hypothetical protein SDRG_07215 [Saprolegnia diclina VS20]|eukprot:XP_008611257.1 hypothetical protein SDRG_07215 [Saprolegnia diclina VS20]
MGSFKERYAFSGGSLREFLGWTEDQPKEAALHMSDVAILAFETGNDAAPNIGIDSIRRAYIDDIDKYAHYLDRSFCRRIVDARVAQRYLMKKTRLGFFVDMLRWVEMTKYGSLYGWLYEATIHKLAFDCKLVLRLQCYDVSKKRDPKKPLKHNDTRFLEVSSHCEVVSVGSNTESCIEFLETSLTDNMYWTPDFALFPGFDAVLVRNKIVFYLQVTVRPTHPINWGTFMKSHDVVKRNPNLVGFQYVFAFVTPPPPKVVWECKITSDINGLSVCFAYALRTGGMGISASFAAVPPEYVAEQELNH